MTLTYFLHRGTAGFLLNGSKLLGGLSLILLALACGRVHDRHFIQPEGPRWPSGHRLDQVFIAPEAAAMIGKRLTVELINPMDTVQVVGAKMYKPDDWQEYWERWRAEYENTLADVLWRTKVFQDVGTPADPNPIEQPHYKCQVALTEWNEGRGWMRFVIGFGAGATRMQWEGRITELAGGRTVMTFADARRHPGGPSMLGLDLRPLRGPVLISEDLVWAFQDLGRALRRITGTEEKPRSNYDRHKKYRWEGMYEQDGDETGKDEAPTTDQPAEAEGD